jgi:cation:H+ antiporter
MMYVQVIAGFVLLVGGAEALVRGSAAIARRFGVSSMIIGMTVVAFGTSAPEFVVTMNASLAGAAGLAVGNIVGSNIANILLIVGLTALFSPIAAHNHPRIPDMAFLAASSLLFVALAWTGVIERWAGGILVIVFFSYFGWSAWRELSGRVDAVAETRSQEAAELADLPGGSWVAWAAAVLGLFGLVLGADQVVDGGVAIARTFGVSDAVIGLTLVALGTSLPELATSVIAGLRGHMDIALGNILGSNLFNILFIAGAVAMIEPLPVDPQIVRFDSLVMLAATALFLPCLFGVRTGRLAGSVLVCGYAAYIAAQALGAPLLPW